jgi:hypothetical protein
VKKTGDTRNYLTHFNPRLKEKAAEGEDLWILSHECVALLEFCMLRALGFDSATSLHLSAQTPTFQLLMKRKGTLASPMAVVPASPIENVGSESPHNGGEAAH